MLIPALARAALTPAAARMPAHTPARNYRRDDERELPAIATSIPSEPTPRCRWCGGAIGDPIYLGGVPSDVDHSECVPATPARAQKDHDL